MKKEFTFYVAMAFCFLCYQASAGRITELSKNNNQLLLSPGEGSDGVTGKLFITAGAGFNTQVAGMVLRYGWSDLFTDSAKFDLYGTSYKSTPMFHGIIDYGIGEKFTIGGGIGYQKLTVSGWTHDEYDILGNNIGSSSHTDTWTRINIGVRGLLHFVRKEKISLYTGMRFGYNIYSHKTTYSDPLYFDKLNVTPSAQAVQALFGFSFYFTEMIGVNTEVGVGYGGPYYYHIGMSCKLGG